MSTLGAELVTGRILSVGIGGVDGKKGMYRAGAWVPVRVHVENRSAEQFVGRVGVEQGDLDGDKVMSVGAEVILPVRDVEGRDVWVYYWPRPDDDLAGVKSVVVLKGKDLGTVAGTIALPAGDEYKALGISTVGQDDGRSQRFVVLLGGKAMGFGSYVGSWGGTEGVRFQWVQAARDMPDNVLGLDGVDAIVWQADELKPSDIPPDFQLKAMLEWVRAGGHLIISVSRQGEEFTKADERLRAAMPITLTGTRELKFDDLLPYFPEVRLPGGQPGREIRQSRLIQATGTLKPGARAVSGMTMDAFAENPLAVTGLYGQGAVTVVTVDMGNPVLATQLKDEDWMALWNQVAGWQGQRTQMMGNALYQEKAKTNIQPTSARGFKLGETISQQIDVAEETAVRFLVAILFLGLYWLAAGPIGHLVLRYYKVVHWSWWIFGGTVVVAAGAAGVVVMFLQLTHYDLRHRTVVLGTVGSKDVTAVGYYGVFAPSSGPLPVSQPGSDGGMNYLAPLCVPTYEGVKPFADPQSYELWDETAKNEEALKQDWAEGRGASNAPRPVFRNTLKKMQGRWTGQMGGIDVATAVAAAAPNQRTTTGSPGSLLTGTLVNNSGYDLVGVEIVVHTPAPLAVGQGSSYLLEVGKWPRGKTVDLAADAKLEQAGRNPIRLEELLNVMGKARSSLGLGAEMGNGALTEADKALIKGRREDLLDLFLDARAMDSLRAEGRAEAVRGLARNMDCTKELYAAGAMIVARAGDTEKSEFVKSPVPITVNGRMVEGKGEVLFAWALPVGGKINAPRDMLQDRRGGD